MKKVLKIFEDKSQIIDSTSLSDNEPESFRIDRTASKGSRLVLRAENANEPQQYDTLRGIRPGGGGSVIEEPVEGTYNTLSQVT